MQYLLQLISGRRRDGTLKSKRRSLVGWMFNSLWKQWRDDLTPAGKILVWCVVLTGLGAVTVQMPIYQMFCALIVLLSGAATVAVMFRPKVEIEGSLPARTTVGIETTAVLTVTNRGMFPAFDLSVAAFDVPAGLECEIDQHIVGRLDPGRSVRLPLRIKPKSRGTYQLADVRAYSLFPFGIGRAGKKGVKLDPLLVVPSFEPMERFRLSAADRYQPGGIALSSRIGESPEYIGNREYVPGEPIGKLDFRAWARTGEPVVREFQEEYFVRVALILDTHISRFLKVGTTGPRDFEAAVSLTAAVADALSSEEYVIDLFAAGPELYRFRYGRSTGNFEHVLEILASVESTSKETLDVLANTILNELNQISAVVFILTGWSPSRRALLESVREAGCEVRAFLVSGDVKLPPPTEIDAGVVRLTPAAIETGFSEGL
ncbi:DUF58 domain-containing protein [Stratiformator vulcanicus]|uniref:DUF58 domain-containing protein n=1 Tax=Stratiformator vulcanicus TaxID=2527980 RepID=A0A517R0A6_9PLAN|nr:DUF58 domain-containing protein [Stratiformator vulcanicus]QDT37298.1 hypothetical protein Pan189_16710 [Stratiformator vulcanicus]